MEAKYSEALTIDFHSDDINAATSDLACFRCFLYIIFSEYVFSEVVDLQLTLISIHTNYREAMVLPNASTKGIWYMSTEFIAMANIIFTILASKLLQSRLPHLKHNHVASLL